MAEERNIRDVYKHQRLSRERMMIQIVGAQAGAVPVFLTNSKFFKLEGEVVDDGQDLSQFYKHFAISTSPIVADPAQDSKNVTVQLKLGSSDWVSCPAGFSSKASAVITPGEVVYFTLPMTGVQLRLSVAQPDADTDMKITVLMSGMESKADF